MTGVLHACLAKRSKKTRGKVLSSLLESLVCPVCHDYMFVPMMTQCGHNYCYECLSSWFDSDKTKELSCPQCRSAISDTPRLNSALQQWLETLIETVEKKGKKNDELRHLIHVKKASEATYKLHKERKSLFGGVFEHSAIGVVDEDDDGILRCSNCHWELEEDEDDVCPHCNSRIRSRNRNASDRSETNRFSLAEETGVSQGVIYNYANSIAGYYDAIYEFNHLYADNVPLEREHRFDLLPLIKSTLPDGVTIYFPSYRTFWLCNMTLNEGERERRVKIVKELEEFDNTDGDLDQFIQQIYDRDRDSLSERHISENDFDRQLRNYWSTIQGYKADVENYAQTFYGSNSVDANEGCFYFLNHFVCRRLVPDSRKQLYFPNYAMYAESDLTVDDDERLRRKSLLSRIEKLIRRGRDSHQIAYETIAEDSESEPDDSEETSLSDFIDRDDDEHDDDLEVHDNVIDIEAEDSEDSNDEDSECDSDYFEHYEDDGFVTGDSLDDGSPEENRNDVTEVADQYDDEEKLELSDESMDDEDDDDEENEVRIPRRRFQVLVDASDEEPM